MCIYSNYTRDGIEKYMNTLQEDVTIVAIKGKIKYPYTFKAGTNPEIIQKAIDYRIANHWVVYRL